MIRFCRIQYCIFSHTNRKIKYKYINRYALTKKKRLN